MVSLLHSEAKRKLKKIKINNSLNEKRLLIPTKKNSLDNEANLLSNDKSSSIGLTDEEKLDNLGAKIVNNSPAQIEYILIDE